jgi:hypothetical protein
MIQKACLAQFTLFCHGSAEGVSICVYLVFFSLSFLTNKTTPSYGHPSAGGELTPSLQDFSDVIFGENKAIFK